MKPSITYTFVKRYNKALTVQELSFNTMTIAVNFTKWFVGFPSCCHLKIGTCRVIKDDSNVWIFRLRSPTVGRRVHHPPGWLRPWSSVDLLLLLVCYLPIIVANRLLKLLWVLQHCISSTVTAQTYVLSWIFTWLSKGCFSKINWRVRNS